MQRAVAASVVLALAAGCVKRDLWVRPTDIEKQRADLRAGKSVTVVSVDNDLVRLAPSQSVRIVDKDRHAFPIRLAEVMSECAGPELETEEPDRLCALHGVDHVIVGQHRESSRLLWQLPLAVGVAGTLGAAGYCASDCARPYNIISIAGLTMLGGVLLYSLLTYRRPQK